MFFEITAARAAEGMILDMSQLQVSVVMPLYNEEKYILGCVESMLRQDYPKENMEWLFVDGGSSDRTKQILKSYQEKYPELIKIYDNPHKTVPYAMNIGIENAVGKYIIRLDAHAEYADNYFSKCVQYLDETGADNVGGVMETKSRGVMGTAIAGVVSSKFGVGNSQFRTNGKSGYVDTVPFGAFRREVFENYGGYDVRLTRNQDNELNYRIRKNGGKIYLANDINLSYYCRDSLWGICQMAFGNGKWTILTSKFCPGTMGVRHFIPFVFVLSLILGTVLSVFFAPVRWLFLAELLLYLLLDVVFSIRDAKKAKYIPLMILFFPCFHISYGIGSVVGLSKWFFV